MVPRVATDVSVTVKKKKFSNSPAQTKVIKKCCLCSKLGGRKMQHHPEKTVETKQVFGFSFLLFAIRFPDTLCISDSCSVGLSQNSQILRSRFSI